MNIQPIIDRVSEAFSFFDFSYFISGSATMTVILTFMWYNGYWPSALFVSWIQIPLLLISVYISGIISLASGKRIRKILITCKCLKIIFNIKDFNEIFINTYNAVEVANLLDDKNKLFDNELEYTRMWGALRADESSSKTVEFLNKFWVTQALCEGLITSCLLAIVSACITYNNGNRIQYSTAIVISALSFLSLIALMYNARKNAENQIIEVILAYAQFYKKDDQEKEKTASSTPSVNNATGDQSTTEGNN